MKNTKLMNKLKTDSKLRKNAIAITAASLVVVICAVSIPVGLHVRNTNVQQAAEITTVPIAETTTLLADVEAVSVTEPTTLAETDDETTTVPDTNGTQDNKSGNSNNSNGSSSSKTSSGSSSGSSNSSGSGNRTSNQDKPTTTKAPSTTKKPVNQSKVWTQAKVDAFVAKSRAYGESIGLIWDDSFNLTNASWQDSIYTGFSDAEEYIYTEAEAYEQMKESLDYTRNNQRANYFKLYVEYNPNNIGNNWAITILWMK